ncbi:hypothetical protein SAMN06295974_3835 [Plantibacter flavus]|uniref:Uncharacterized protein n=1 Tax=Plantibacter flavus TaxID=150123 RepID=A0A3N2BL87_9MICO|nr:hypothetical protein [Plantibacter flavus]ROR76019.1 hypothetical protein EDD42_3971 [Plantibacter flavus]SMG49258.1 hypothetical protein SAMN06295974_3835 [Plantibacter flavus]
MTTLTTVDEINAYFESTVYAASSTTNFVTALNAAGDPLILWEDEDGNVCFQGVPWAQDEAGATVDPNRGTLHEESSALPLTVLHPLTGANDAAIEWETGQPNGTGEIEASTERDWYTDSRVTHRRLVTRGPWLPAPAGITAPKSTTDGPVHWIGDAPTSLHGNGATSFKRTTRSPIEVTCGLCLNLLARDEPSES